jgi:hypothetical protein
MIRVRGGELIRGQELAPPAPLNRLVAAGERAAIFVLGAHFFTKQVAISAAVCWRDEDMARGSGLLKSAFFPPRTDRPIRMELKLPDARVIEMPDPISEFRPGHGLRVHVAWSFEPPIPSGTLRIECEWGDAGLPLGVLEIGSDPLIAAMSVARPAWPAAEAPDQ